MSRGPGKWQRLIVSTLDEKGAVYLRTLLPADCTRSEYVALRRAARSLESTGAIAIDWYFRGRHGKPGAIIIRRPDVEVPPHRGIGRLVYAPDLNVAVTQNGVTATLRHDDAA